MLSPGNQKISKLKGQKGHNSGKNCRNILVIDLDLGIHKLHIYIIPSLNPTFHYQLLIYICSTFAPNPSTQVFQNRFSYRFIFLFFIIFN